MSKDKPDSLDALLQHIQKKNKAEGKIDKAFEQFDKVIDDDDTYNEFYIDILKPAHDDLYESFKDEMLKVFDKDLKKKIKGKDLEKVKKALVKALKKFFEKANKDILEHLDKDADAIEQFDYLARMYDSVTMQEPGKGMYTMADRLLKDGDKLSEIIMQFGRHSEQHRELYLPRLKGKAGQMFLGDFSPHVVAAHVYDEIHSDEGPYTIKDKMKWMAQDTSKVLTARHGVREGVLPEGEKFKDYHIKHKPKEKKK